MIRNAQLRVADFDLPSGADMLLGADFFLSHRLYISREQRRIYFTFNGGHVFDLSRHDDGPDAAAATATAAMADVAPVDPAAIAELRRRASAEAARGELRAAKADFDEAIRKSPGDADTWYQRAQLGFRMGAGNDARKDLDRALELAPALVEGRMLRAQLRLQAKDAPGADEDFKAAMVAAPADSGLALRAAQLQIAVGDRAAGLGQLGAWISGHAGDNRLAEALNTRCWTLATAGEDLDKALDDCNGAIRHGLKNSAFLDSRGLVWLRLGRFDKAIDDYNRALQLQPKHAWSLYGLGLAEMRSGRQSQGQAHVRAATALSAGIAESYRKFGLEP